MSKIIKSNRLNIAEGAFKLSSDVFINKDKYLSDERTKNQAKSQEKILEEQSYNTKKQADLNDDYKPETLIEKAEKAAIEIMDNAQALADELINDARQCARELEQEAMENTNSVYDNAKAKGEQDGFDKGYKDGYDDANKALQEVIDKAQAEYQEALQLKKKLHAKSKEFYTDAEAEIIKMVLDIAKKVIGKEVDQFEYIESLIAEAMKHLNYATDIVLRISPDDYDAACFAKPKILAMAERIENLEIKIDYALIPGSCMIDTSAGSIDAGIKTQLDNIEELFKNIMAINTREPKLENSDESAKNNEEDYQEDDAIV